MTDGNGTAAPAGGNQWTSGDDRCLLECHGPWPHGKTQRYSSSTHMRLPPLNITSWAQALYLDPAHTRGVARTVTSIMPRTAGARYAARKETHSAPRQGPGNRRAQNPGVNSYCRFHIILITTTQAEDNGRLPWHGEL